jgi:hypothetical protein
MGGFHKNRKKSSGLVSPDDRFFGKPKPMNSGENGFHYCISYLNLH